MTMSVPSKKSSAAIAADPAAPVFALLSELLSREIDSGLLHILRLPEVIGVISQIDPEVEGAIVEDWSDSAFEAHAVEFCRLFVHPCECLPLAEKWAGGDPEGKERYLFHRWFDEEGNLPQLAPHIQELSDTHVAKLLAVRAGLSGVPEEVIERFEQEMLAPWSAAFSARLTEVSSLPVYRATASLLRAMV